MNKFPPSDSSQPMQRRLIIIGAGGHATSCADVACAAGYKHLVFVDRGKAGQELMGFPILDSVPEEDNEVHLLIAVGDNAVRERIYEEMTAQFPQARFPAIIHPAASVSSFARAGPGTVVMAGAVVGSRTRCGRCCIVNTRAAIDHVCVLEDFASLAPGAVTGGAVSIGERTAICIAAVIKHHIRVGRDSVIGACAYVNKPIGDQVIAYGVPARVMRQRQRGDPYLG